jgi:hypothetical protein
MSVAALHSAPPLEPSLAALFPLPLTTLEAFMVADTRPGYSMMCDVELEFQGVVDRAAFESALAFAVARNPLFACNVRRDVRGALAWVPSGRLPTIEWLPLDASLGDAYGALVDLATDLGLRVWVRQGSHTAKVLVYMHHACSDALGVFGFLGDLLAAYANTCPEARAPQVRTLDSSRLLERGNIGIDGRPWYRRLYDTVIGAREAARFFLLRPPALAAATATTRHETPGPVYTTHTVSDDVTAGLRAAATRARATVNDVLLRDLYVTLRRWNTEHGAPPGRRPLRILMPQNLRSSSADYATPAANIMSFAFVSRAAHLCDAPDELLESIREETEAVRRGKLSLYFLGGLATLQARGLQTRVLDSQMVFATAVLTNLGDPTHRFGTRFAQTPQGLQVGNLRLTRLAALPPLRPNTRAAFSVCNRRATLDISLKWDPLYFSPLDANDLLGQYVAQLRATAERVGTTAGQGTLAP